MTNDQLLDLSLQHQIRVQQYGNELAAELVAALDEYDTALFTALLAALANLPPGASTSQVDATVASVLQQNSAAYAEVLTKFNGQLPGFAEQETAFAKQTVLAARGEPYESSVDGGDLTALAFGTIAGTLIQGSTFSEHVDNLVSLRAKALRDGVRAGWSNQQTPTDIVRALRGTVAARFGDGTFQTHRNYLESLARAAVTGIAEKVQAHIYGANGETFRAVMWVSVLDGRTTPACQARAGKLYDAKTHRPIGHSHRWGAGPGALHWGCRSTSAPVLPGTLPDQPSYGSWLRRQSAEFQDQVLGRSRGALFRTGEFTPERFVNEAGRRLTLGQLRAQDAKLFSAAGVPLRHWRT